MCNLQRVGQAESFDDAVAFASRYPIETVSPHLEEREGILWLCIPEHLGYPVTSAPMPHLVQTGRTIIQVDGTSKAEIKVLPG